MFNLLILFIMFGSKFAKRFVRVFPQRSLNTVNLVSRIDKFVNSDFFFDESTGNEISAPILLAKAQNDPELAAKIQQLIIERDVQGMPEDASNEDVMKTIDLKYNTVSYLRDTIDKRIIELRSEQSKEAS